jgi:hypothetical protein
MTNNLEQCTYCRLPTVFENKLIKRCLKCMRDFPKQDDFSLEDDEDED